MKTYEEYTTNDISLGLEMSKPVTRLSSHRRFRPANFDNPAFEADSHAVEVKVRSTYDLEKPYNPHEHCSVEHPTSFWGMVFHTIILMAGPGVLSIPTLFVQTGYLSAAILMPCIFYLYVHNTHMILCSEYQQCKTMRIPTLPYAQVVYHVFNGHKFSRWFSKWSRRLLYIDFFIVWYSYYCYNFIIVSQNLQVLLHNMFHIEVSITTLLEIITIPMLLLACVPKLKHLVPVSFVGMVANGVSLVLIVYFVFSDPTPWNIPSMVGPLSSVPVFIGAVLININISGMLITLKNEMKEPHRFSNTWFGVMIVSFTPTSALYTAFSLICALKYGDSVKPSVIQNLPQNDLLAQIGVALSSLAIICQQPLILVVAYDVIWHQILKKQLKSEHPLAWEYVLRIVLVLLAFVISVVLPNIFLFLLIGGAVGTSIDSLILPGLMYTIVKWKMGGSRRKFWFIFIKNIIIILFAVALAIIGCIDCVSQIKDFYSHQN